MRGGVKQRRTRRSRLNLPKSLQGKLLYARKGAEHPPGRREKPPVTGDLDRDAVPVQSTKSQLDATSEIDLLPAKRARSTRTDTQRPGVADEKEDQADKTTLQQPEPTPPTRSYVSVLEPEVERTEQLSPATRLRKRQIGSDGDGDDNEHQSKRTRLTRKNLALFNKMAKKKGTNKVSAPESTVESSTTKTTSTTSSGFAIQARKNGILNPLSSKPPENLEDIRKRYPQPRGTASPTESVYEDYVNTVGGVPNEATMVFEVGAQLLKKYDDKGYKRAFNQTFTGFPKDVGFNNALSVPQPDFVEGLRMEEYRPFPVDEHVSGAVLYKDDPLSLTLPHLAGEWKGPGKDMAEARLQSAYDGAALVYARNQALSYLGKSDPPGHAMVTTFTTDGTNLNLYAHYATPSEDGTLEYHQYPVRSTNLIDCHQGLKDGRRGLRNEQDHAFKESCALRDHLKEHWKQRGGGLDPIAKGALLPIPDVAFEETTPHDGEADYEIVGQPCQPTPAASSEPRKASSSLSSSKSLQPAEDCIPGGGGQKRKASLSSQGSSDGSARQRSKYKSYWKRDAESGRYFHKHSDGMVTWLDEDDDGC